MAELHAIVMGLTLVVDVGALQIVIESYLKYGVELISFCDPCFNKSRSFLQDVAELASKIYVIHNFVPRDHNGVAHGLASHTFLFTFSESYDFLFSDWLVDFHR